jgi:hypothetical protein
MLLASVLLSVWFYPIQKKNSSSPILLQIKRLCRALSLFLILALLLHPVWLNIDKNQVKPSLLIFVDDSQSLRFADSAGLALTQKNIDYLQDKLQDEAEIEVFYFGNHISDSSGIDGQEMTDLSMVNSYASQFLRNKKNASILVASDGIYNTGLNPLFNLPPHKIHIHTLPLGDTTIKKDLIVKDVRQNRFVFLNNRFNVLVQIQANALKGHGSVLKLIQKGKILDSKPILINSQNEYMEISLSADASEPGIQRFSIIADSIPAELTYKNNVFDFYMDVIDDREKILIVYHAPHPDVGAIADALEVHQNYEVVIKPSSQLNEDDVKKAGLIIGHQFPLSMADHKWAKMIRQLEIPIFHIIGGQSTVEHLDQLLPGVKIQPRSRKNNDAQAFVNKSFNGFALSESLLQHLPSWPPLQTPFGNYLLSPSFEVILQQKINQIETQYPLLVCHTSSHHRIGFLLGENCWRWRVTDAQTHLNTSLFDELILKMVRLLMIKETKQRFKVYPTKDKFMKGEQVKIHAEVYDQNLSPIQDADIWLKIKNEDGLQYSYQMQKETSYYSANMGSLDAQFYTFEAGVNNYPFPEHQKGAFLVEPVQVELINLKADFQLLRNWSSATGGTCITHNHPDTLLHTLINDPHLVFLTKNKTQNKELLEFLTLLALIISFLGLEWFIRKWEGKY